jgi:sodium transport system permease protein
MSTTFIVMKKELVDIFRDRRTTFLSIAVGPLLTPALLIGIMVLANSRSRDADLKPLDLPVAGAEYAPTLVTWLKGNNVNVKAAPEDIDSAVRSQAEDVVLRISPEFPAAWRAGTPALVEIVSDHSRREQIEVPVSRLEALLQGYDRQMGALRLVARGVAPSVMTPLAIARRDVSTPESRVGLILAFFPYLLILSGFVGGSSLATDATAGERERQSLEPLLANPVSRAAIMSGKIAAVCTFSLLSQVVTLVAMKIGFAVTPAEAIGMTVDISWVVILKLLLITSTLVVFGSSLITLLAATAKSVKEAGSYLVVLVMMPMIPTLALMVSPVKNQLWQFAVPFLAQNQMIMKIVRGESMTSMEWLVGLGTNTAVAGLTWLIASRLYQREQLAISA